VSYSPDRGHHWETLFFGPNHNRLTLLPGAVRDGNNGRVRIVVSDGFNQKSAQIAVPRNA
jgi:hypothetical protein